MTSPFWRKATPLMSVRGFLSSKCWTISSSVYSPSPTTATSAVLTSSRNSLGTKVTWGPPTTVRTFGLTSLAATQTLTVFSIWQVKGPAIPTMSGFLFLISCFIFSMGKPTVWVSPVSLSSPPAKKASRISTWMWALCSTAARYMRPMGKLPAGGSEPAKNVCGGLIRRTFMSDPQAISLLLPDI